MMTIEEERELFYRKLGMAIAEWAVVEESLALIFLKILHAPNDGSALSAYYSLTNSKARLDLINAASIHAFGGKPEADEWSKLYDRTRKRLERRNQIAHFVVMGEPKNRPGERVFIRPNITNALARIKSDIKGKPLPTYNHSQLDSICISFNQLSEDLWQFGLKLPGKPMPRVKDQQ